MTEFLFDTSVLLDVATLDPVWNAWSTSQLQYAQSQGPIWINPIIYAELAPAFASKSDLEQFLIPAVFQRSPLPYAAGWLASQAFVAYRRAGGLKRSPLPDFFIGGHAEAEGLTLVTRDAARFRTYFPNVAIISP